jgi:hypothetical protein
MQSTQLIGVKLDWGDQEVGEPERAEVEAILDRTIHAALGYTTRRAFEQFGHPVRGEVEVTAL